jgi:glycosyltransferase involved in cell wall biosynthesis
MIFIIKKTISTKVVFHSSSADESMTIINNLGKNVRIVELPNYMILPEREQRSTSEKYLLYLGRIQPDKRLEKLILGYSLSKAKELQIPLKIAGDNNNAFAKTLEKLVNDNDLRNLVHFLGYVTGKQKQTLLANAYFSFLLSDGENFGNVVIESMAQGTPVIVSQNIPWKILEERKAGLWIENTPAQIGETIDKVLEMNNEVYLNYRSNAINLVTDQYDVNINISKWISIFNQMLKEN